MNDLTPALLFRCFLRTYLVGAAYNPRGLQNIGFIFALEPALVALYGEGEGLRAARMRYARHYNCHPFWAPLLLGVFLHTEIAISAGRVQPAALNALKETTTNTLSAIGDSFFGGSLLVTWGLGASCLVLAGAPQAAGLLTLGLFLALQAFKFSSFTVGLRKGLAVLFVLRRYDLINKGEAIKCCNGALLAAFLYLALPGAPIPTWISMVLYLLVAGWIIGKIHVSRVFVALVILVLALAMHMTGLFGEIPALLKLF